MTEEKAHTFYLVDIVTCVYYHYYTTTTQDYTVLPAVRSRTRSTTLGTRSTTEKNILADTYLAIRARGWRGVTPLKAPNLAPTETHLSKGAAIVLGVYSYH